MVKYIALDDGHGMLTAGKRTPFIESIGRYIPENEFNRAVVKYLNEELKRCGFKTLLTAPTDADTPLKDRVDAANRAKVDLFISIHYNAVDGKFDGDGKDPEGFSAHVQSKLYNSAKFANVALKHLAGGTVQKNRGLVQQDLYVTRETNMPAVLFELGFMDNSREALLMIDVSFQKECATELARAVCEFYGVKYVAAQKPVTVSPPKSLVKLGVAKMLRDVPAYAAPSFGTQTGDVVKKGTSRNIYTIDNGWFQLSGGEYLPSNYGKNFDYTPVKKTEPSTQNMKRVLVDGKSIGSFSDPDNLERNVLLALKKNFKKIEVEDIE